MDELGFDLLEELKSFKIKVEALGKRQNELQQQLSNVDKKLCDIMHCAELYDLDACRGYKLYKILKKTRIERREIKNELHAINETLSKVSVKNLNASIKEVEYSRKEDKNYTPRVVEELFDLLK